MIAYIHRNDVKVLSLKDELEEYCEIPIEKMVEEIVSYDCNFELDYRYSWSGEKGIQMKVSRRFNSQYGKDEGLGRFDITFEDCSSLKDAFTKALKASREYSKKMKSNKDTGN